MKKRIQLFDNLKAVLIFLVVVGHIYGLSMSNSLFFGSTYVFIYLFHMPLFVFVSGYFTKVDKSFSLNFAQLFIPYLIVNSIWQLLFTAIQNKGVQLSLFHPYGYLWYLFSLFIWRIALKYLYKVKFIIPISFFIGIIAGFLPLGEYMSLSRTVTFLPFFLLGYYIKDNQIAIVAKIKSISRPYIIGSLIVLIVFSLLYHQFGIPKEHLLLAFPYQYLGRSNTIGLLIRVAVYVLSIIGSVLIIWITPNHKTVWGYIGERTMSIYIGHIFIRFIITQLIPMNTPYFKLVILISPVLITLFLALPIWSNIYRIVLEKLFKTKTA